MVKIVNNAKYQGVIIDNKLEFQEHIKLLESKVARSIGVLSKVKHTLPKTTLLHLYYILVHPLLL